MLSFPPSTTPGLRRPTLALGAGVLCGLVAWLFMRRSGFVPDIAYPYVSAQVWVAGHDPFLTIRGGAAPPYDYPAVYPFPAVLLLAPLAALGLGIPTAGAIVAGAFSTLAIAAWARHGGARVHAFVSASFVLALSLGQWSPLLLAGASTWPVLLGLGMAAKPTVGLAAFCYRPSWRAGLVAATIFAISVVILPAWPLEWLANTRLMPRVGGAPVQRAPFLLPGGVVLLAALLRWRTREARLLLAMAAMPHTLFFYDELLLWLCVRTRSQSAALALATTAGFLGWLLTGLTVGQGTSLLATAPPWVLWTCYVPALLVVLRHQNAGADDDTVVRTAERLAVRAREFLPMRRRAARSAGPTRRNARAAPCSRHTCGQDARQ